MPIYPHSYHIVMIPLKRLLNEEATKESQFTRNKEYRNSHSEIPALAEKTWDALWGDILSSDISNDVLLVENYEGLDTSIHAVEEDIEQWVLQSMPLVIEAPSDLQKPPSETMKLTSVESSTTQLCYGMVCLTNRLLSAVEIHIFSIPSLIQKHRFTELRSKSKETC